MRPPVLGMEAKTEEEVCNTAIIDEFKHFDMVTWEDATLMERLSAPSLKTAVAITLGGEWRHIVERVAGGGSRTDVVRVVGERKEQRYGRYRSWKQKDEDTILEACTDNEIFVVKTVKRWCMIAHRAQKRTKLGDEKAQKSMKRLARDKNVQRSGDGGAIRGAQCVGITPEYRVGFEATTPPREAKRRLVCVH